MRIKHIFSVVVSLTLLAGCSSNSAGGTYTSSGGVTVSKDLKSAPVIGFTNEAGARIGLLSEDVVEGNGAVVVPTSSVTVNYTGIGMTSRKKFDSSWDRGQPITFSLDQVIEGWKKGMVGMKVGGRRLLIIPGEMAYRMSPPAGIGPNETLVFVVDLTAVK